MSEGQTHDYRNGARYWGRDITWRLLDRDRLAATGWGRGLKVGDYILLSNGDTDTRYSVCTIDYYADPPDMWRATLWFAPRGES